MLKNDFKKKNDTFFFGFDGRSIDQRFVFEKSFGDKTFMYLHQDIHMALPNNHLYFIFNS